MGDQRFFVAAEQCQHNAEVVPRGEGAGCLRAEQLGVGPPDGVEEVVGLLVRAQRDQRAGQPVLGAQQIGVGGVPLGGELVDDGAADRLGLPVRPAGAACWRAGG